MAQVRAFKLADRAAQGAVLALRDTTAQRNSDGESPLILSPATGAPVTLTLLGADSPQARRIDYRTRAAFQTRVLTRATSGKKSAGITADDIADQETQEIELLAALTIDWSGVIDADGAPCPCTLDNARDLYTGDADIREQALLFVGDRTRFFAPSSTPSAPTPSISSGLAA